MTVCQLLLFSLLTLACGPAPSQYQSKTATSTLPKTLLNIRDIAHQTQEDIATILGHQSQLDPASAEKSGCPTCQKYSYQDGRIEIIYINDMADWITVFPPKDTPARQVPVLLGLSDTPPDNTSPGVWRWKNIAGIREIRAHLTAQGTVESVYVVAMTPSSRP